MAYQATLNAVDLCIINIRAEKAAISVLSSVAGLSFPQTHNCISHDEKRKILWLGPDQWLMISEDQGDAKQVEKINSVCNDFHANATLLTDQYAGFILQGEQVHDVMVQGFGINLDPSVFTFGQCASCSFARTHAILVPQPIEKSYLIMIESSLAEYLEQWFDKTSGQYLKA